MAVLPGLFGGDNVVGFFGGGHRRLDPNSYNLPNMQNMQDENWNLASAAGARGNDIYGRQTGLFNNLMGTINGQGPSVAQQQLQNTTQNNIANAYAMAQSGRYNPAAARQAAMAGSQANQQAAGQGALLRAQEIQNAQGMLGGLLGQSYGQSQATQAGYLGQNQQMAEAQLQANIAREQQEAQNFGNAQQNAVGGKLISAAGSALGGLMPLFRGGGGGGGGADDGSGYQGYSQAPSMLAHGGQVRSVMGDRVCPGCGHLNSECTCYARAEGGPIPGKAKVSGDSAQNDRVRAMLSPGEIVLPRSVSQDEDAPEKAKAFVKAIQAKRMKKAA